MTKRQQRCVIYTRKSSEEGLEQNFNSLHAQREACEAFIKSQAGEGWTFVPTHYDDGGISGGTMQRPALQKLLADIAAGKVDVVVVYKVDRLTRSLADFAKMVELFDAHNVSFVAVTQQFNTTTSMGRLTLNVLLSFAQFEREVTGERIRDKIAASKRKGMWMGGQTPLGYNVVNRALVVDPPEAKLVERIYRAYLRLGAVRLVKRELDSSGVTSKPRRYKGELRGGGPLFPGAIYGILSNPVYVGRIAHKDQVHKGLHEPIIGTALWDAVQARIAENRAKPHGAGRVTEPSPLIGKLFDESGRRLTPKHTKKGARRIRYYVSRCFITGTEDREKGWRLPAAMIEQTLGSIATDVLGDRKLIASAIEAHPDVSLSAATSAASAQARRLRAPATRTETLAALIERVELRAGQLDVRLGVPVEGKRLILTTTKGLKLKRRGIETKVLIEGPAAPGASVDTTLIRGIARGHQWLNLLVSAKVRSIAEISRQDKVSDRYVSRLVRLAFLSPELTEAILSGTQSPTLSLQSLLSHRLELAWPNQRRALLA